ncbi:hypothetical protein [Paenibacillus aceris]|uniref:Uncharacterized protein n=1 Tax=Paenibacillus aceris TaxID=869555 RepID=A0ABS4I665_9BACL|nr:hypothetical protein [Paenibacillus aceris]MBP1966407.1 hypothetical protein [Paenibacillus aceris]
MNTLWNFIVNHWISLALIIGVLLAIWYEYKNKDKYIRGGRDK